MPANGLLGREQLSADEIAALQALEARCALHDSHGVKLNWEMLKRRPHGLTNDFCWYVDGALVGYAPLDPFGPDAELTVLVAPERRRHGIGGALADAAVAEARRRGVAELLLVSERASTSGSAFAAARGLHFGNAEYHLKLDASVMPAPATTLITMRAATPTDLPALIRLMHEAFDLADEGEARQIAETDLTRAGARAYLAEVDGATVGRISALISDKEVYLRAFSVLARYRGRGIGRALLLGTIAQLRAEGHRHFSLDVVTDNHNALGLYTSSGFREASVYDYYPWPLTD